jgi:hypothetical protein
VNPQWILQAVQTVVGYAWPFVTRRTHEAVSLQHGINLEITKKVRDALHWALQERNTAAQGLASLQAAHDRLGSAAAVLQGRISAQANMIREKDELIVSLRKDRESERLNGLRLERIRAHVNDVTRPDVPLESLVRGQI